MGYSGYLLKIGDYKIPHKYIKADSYQAYANMQDIDPWIDSNGYTHREETVELKALKVEFETKPLLTNKQFDEDLIANIRNQFVKEVGKECYITAYIPELGKYVTQYGYMADFTPQMYRVTLFGKTVTASNGEKTVSGVFGDLGSVILQIPWIGETTITSTDGTDTATSVVTISAYESTYSVDLSFLKIVTFADGTDEEIVAMIEAHYNDKINIADYWAVGDTRTVHLSAMSATGVGESHREQDVEFVIGDFEHDDLTTPINGHSKAAVTLLQKDCLMDATSASNVNDGSADTEKGYMNSSNTNVGGWKSCARRTWCNNVYFSVLPSVWQSMVKTVNKKTSVGNTSSEIETVQDKIFLAAEIEIFGSAIKSYAGEGAQYQYYKNATANRYKMPKWSSSNVSNLYWERSPYNGSSASAGYSMDFCIVYISGDADRGHASGAYGVAPCLCI